MKTVQRPHHTPVEHKNLPKYGKFAISAKVASYVAALLLALVPFHAFLTVWAASLLGHYTQLRLWGAVLLLLLVVLGVYWLARDQQLRRTVRDNPILSLTLLYALFTLLLGARALLYGLVTGTALAYGLLSDLRYLAFFVAVSVTLRYSQLLRIYWRPLVLVPLGLVAAFAVLQYSLLPLDFLRHFGYGPHTIAPFETINNNSAYPRVMSTLRGANPLGAYLVVGLGLVASLWLREKRSWRLYLPLSVLCALALVFSFSRSAWLGAVVTGLFVVSSRLRTSRQRLILGAVALGLSLLFAAGLVLLRHDVNLQNAFLHTQDHSKVTTNSNGERAKALSTGVKEVLHEPFGRGPGTAGPASVYNHGHPVRISENHYVQIAQELGWAGLGIFVALQVFIFLRLWKLRTDPLAMGIFASGIGLIAVNMLSHAWADDTLAYIWWGLAALALAPKETARD